ncbi:beta-galactosidase [Odoribacter laneus]|nr:beta-galactosidase [Odoribacter laneus]GKI24306.1 beta-galactosidase [Odoribacter laneus]
MTRWGKELRPDRVWQEYPRPIMEREVWKNLNGLWEYAVVPMGSPEPETYEGQILVPFALESALSGVGRVLEANEELWYKREFQIDPAWKKKRILLHFEAVDWKTDVWVNGVKVGNHSGGYTPFTFDITSALVKGDNRLTVRVSDPTDQGIQPRGKQVRRPEGIWYTSVSGIWQTVWLEPVPEHSISYLRVTPDIDRRILSVEVSTESKGVVQVEVSAGGKTVSSSRSLCGQRIEVPMPADMLLWSPENPFLYDLSISLWEGNRCVDRVKSYAAMRKYSVKRDESGIVRLQLNNQDLFQYGPLDQGWWPDGLYTAPSDSALLYDIAKTKEWGFNMIRKHVKVEPARWYYHCDRLGMIVWQDMPNGDRGPEWQNRNYFKGTEYVRSSFSESVYRKEWQSIIDHLYSYPCIGVWVPFNEAWGQFKTEEIVRWTKDYDPGRLVNPASGGNHYTCGDILDLHNYPTPELYLYDAQRATVLGEFGGIGLVCKEHLWEPSLNWGYIELTSNEEAMAEYEKYATILKNLICRGFSAAVYTQTTDVEREVNGFMTYDREKVKLDENKLREINKEICNSLEKK